MTTITPIPWPGDDSGPERCLAFVVWQHPVGSGDWMVIESRCPDEGPDYYVFSGDEELVYSCASHITHYLPLPKDPR